MRIFRAVISAFLLVTLVVSGQAAFGDEGIVHRFLIPSIGLHFLFTTPAGPSSRIALAQRQRLWNEVRFAMLDGYISPDERIPILMEAQGILLPEEYQQFRRVLDQISPPRMVPMQRASQMARQRAATAQRMSLQMPRPTNPVIPAGATLPDRPASDVILR
jgi:hypothetical protein